MISLLLGFRQIVHYAIDIYTTLLVIYALMSWLPNARDSKFGYYVARLCEPYLDVFRRLIPPIGMVSFSVIFAILFLNLVRYGFDVLIQQIVALLV